MKNVMVTGGAGFIGTHLALKLEQRGCSVSILDNLTRSRKPQHSGFVYGDVRDSATLESACRGIDTIFHLAAQSSVLTASANPRECVSTNVGGTAALIDAAADAGVRRVVFTSSREVYGDAVSFPVSEDAPLNPKNHYGASKAAAELYCAIRPTLEVVVLRLANVYGPGDSGRVIPLFISAAKRGEQLTIYGSGKSLDLVWIEDVVAAITAAGELSVAGETFNIGGGCAVTLYDLALRILAVTGSSSPIVFAPERSVEVNCYLGNIDRARRLLNFHPHPEVLYGLDQMVAAAEVLGS